MGASTLRCRLGGRYPSLPSGLHTSRCLGPSAWNQHSAAWRWASLRQQGCLPLIEPARRDPGCAASSSSAAGSDAVTAAWHILACRGHDAVALVLVGPSTSRSGPGGGDQAGGARRAAALRSGGALAWLTDRPRRASTCCSAAGPARPAVVRAPARTRGRAGASARGQSAPPGPGSRIQALASAPVARGQPPTRQPLGSRG